MASIQPSTGASLIRDAHYHPIKATVTWASYAAAMAELATNTAAERERVDARRSRATTYARGTLGKS